MTLCLTFDDGLKSQAVIAAPMVAAHGWSASFNVITGMLDGVQPSEDMIRDLYLLGHEDSFMTWVDAHALIENGHEVYPHTASHVDVVKLEAERGFDAVRKEIDDSVAAMKRNLGYNPKYFCFPHYASSPRAITYLHGMGIEVFNGCRPNFGDGGAEWAAQSSTDILGHLRQWRKNGVRHMDISIHGITQATGGWCPFADEDAFAHFLNDISACEKEEWLRVVPYSKSHIPYNRLSRMRHACCRIADKASHLAARMGVYK